MAPAWAEVVVGVAVPGTGLKAAAGRRIVDAATAQVATLNAEGGAGGQALRLVLADDGCSETGGRDAAEALIEQGAVLVLGHPCDGAAMAAARVYAGAGVWFGAIGAQHPALTAKRAGPAIFRLTGSAGDHARDTAANIASVAAGKRIAIVHDRTAYARKLADGVAAGLKAVGSPAELIDGLVAGEIQYTALAGRLVARGVEAVYFAGFAAERQILKRDLAAAGAKTLIIANDVSASGTLTPIEGTPDGERDFFMARRPDDEAQTTRAALEAFVRSGNNLQSFAAALGLGPKGDRTGPTYGPARERAD